MSISPKQQWSQQVTQQSRALKLTPGIFTWSNPRKIALSLKESALRSKARKGTPLQSAMSMLNFYINRAGSRLPASQKKVLQKTKLELRKLFHK